ncbi:MAG: TonB family protein, partial [Candidatus Eisenbacteria bacterium]|nr:TonB family protein [Candidatus Eisenbacteria bacterium]
VASTALHFIGIIFLSVTWPTKTRPMVPPIYFVTLEPAAVPEETPQPPVKAPVEKAPSPVKMETKKKETPKQDPPKKKTVEAPKPKQAPAASQDEALDIRTDQPSFVFNYYLDSIRRKISSRWQPPAGVTAGKEKVVMLHFRILRDGSVIGPTVEEGSGIDLLDQSTIRAVLEAVPLPPLPPAYDGPWLGVHLRFVRHD